MTIIIHVGSMSLKSACDLVKTDLNLFINCNLFFFKKAMHAEQSGAAAIAAMPPSYIKPPSLG